MQDARVAAEHAVAVSPDFVGGQEYFGRQIQVAERLLGGLADEVPIVRDFVKASIFATLANISWLIE
jgi:hypothetical protein